MSTLTPNGDLDGYSDHELLDLFHKVKAGWQPRDEVIQRAVELRDQTWNVAVPKAWRKTATQHHTSRSKEIPERVKGTIMLNTPIYSRANPGEDFGMGEDQNQVERWHSAYFKYWDQTAMLSRSAYEFMLDNLVSKGAVCVGSLKAPQVWAGAPTFMDGEKIRQDHWRDDMGKVTDDYMKVDEEASGRAHKKAVDKYRQTASTNVVGGFPLKRRMLKPEQTFPMIQDDQMNAMFIERKVNMVELGANGWSVDVEMKNAPDTMLEIVTPNRIRYYLGENEIVHEKSGPGGLVTDYGFVPYVYQTSLSAGETEYGAWGLPILALIDSNIRTYDTLKTFLMNAVHLASFTSFVIEYVGDERTVASLVESRTGKTLTTFDFKTGTIMDFGPGRRVVPLTHPGLNADFWKALAAEEHEMDRIIPRTLTGEAASSGYNTVSSSVQAKALFASMYKASELVLQQAGKMDMRHIETLPGPVFLEWEKPSNARSKQFSRVQLDKSLIGGYYHLQVDIDRVVDPITEGTFRANMVEKGIGDVEWAAEGAGIVDYEDMLARQARDRVFQSETTRAALETRAVKRFKLQMAVQEAASAGRIETGPDGTPMVGGLPGGRTAGPGAGIQGGQGVQAAAGAGPLGIQTPSAQGGAGASGGLNNNTAVIPGGPNLSAVAAPNTQPTANRGRSRGRGGAIPGAPQRPKFITPPQNPLA